MINEHLRAIREFEAEAVLPWLPPRGRLLEIGAGAGWQAAIFARAGLQVFAIELPHSEYLPYAEFPTIRYDGRVIPFADETFDVIFSSNVLEHIPHIEAFQQEMIRVLRPWGRMIHVLPTTAWRLATTATHYLWVAKTLVSIAQRPKGRPTCPPGRQEPSGRQKLRSLLPSRHGEFGNWVSEAYYFSHVRWQRVFVRAGLTVEACRPLGLFYMGYSVADARLPLTARQRISHILGSGSRLYVLSARRKG